MSKSKTKPRKSENRSLKDENERLKRQNARLQLKLKRAEGLLDLQKKAQAMLESMRLEEENEQKESAS